MKNIIFTFPEGRRKALTMSYDDGVVEDRKLVEIFNKYGIKGTFHINGGLLGKGNHLVAEELSALYRGHEVSCHSFTHPFLERVPRITALNQVLEDRRELEAQVGYPVRGMSYPMGTYDSEVLGILKSADIAYCRTVRSTGSFGLPDNWLEWHPTCHHREDILAKAEIFKELRYSCALFYVWGHAFEFERNCNWGLIEDFCAAIAKVEDIWYATNIEIYNYLTALRRLEFSVSGNQVRNTNSIPVWINVEGEIVQIAPGELKNL
jgi:peptidoglycan/xylan/chitin deacetylase (PgdA/CDA1 family)